MDKAVSHSGMDGLRGIRHDFARIKGNDPGNGQPSQPGVRTCPCSAVHTAYLSKSRRATAVAPDRLVSKALGRY